MKKVLLISSNVTTEPYPVYPLGMAVVAAALSRCGYRVEQFDLLAAGSGEPVAARIDSFRPDYVCISMRNLDSCDSLSTTSYPSAVKRLVGEIRAAIGVPVIIGGPAFSIMPEELLSFTGADYGVVGEGEQSLCALLHDLEAGRTPAAIVHGERLLAGPEMTGPLLDDGLIRFYQEQSGMINLQTKRGCPHGCIYCSYPNLEGAGYRCREPKEVVDDLERIGIDHGVNSFFFTDSVFNDDDGHYLAVAEEIIRRRLELRWCCYVRPAGIGRQELALLKRAGLYAVEAGTDAACDATLLSLGKGFTFDQALEVSRACVAEEISCAHFIMFGGPGETAATVAQGLENIAKLEHTVVFAFSGIRILPGTALHTLAVREGMLQQEVPLLDPAYYQSREIAAEVMNDMIAASFRGRRDRVFPPSEGQKRLSIMHRFGYRGLLWDTLIPFAKG